MPSNPEPKPVISLDRVSDEKAFSLLNFSDGQDIDYFEVTYACPASDDQHNNAGPGTSVVSTYLGLSVTHYPPRLYCKASGGDKCNDIAVYRPATVPTLYHSVPKTGYFSLYSPTHLLGAKKCYFQLKNTDFAWQGAFNYNLAIGYVSA